MNKTGNESVDKKSIFRVIKENYAIKLIRRILSFLGTVILVFLLVLGAIMFYFNLQAKAAQERGETYTAPFGLYTIVSGSMEPNVHVYDVVASLEVKDLNDIKIGDIITFISTWSVSYGKTVTHRVVGISKTESGDFQFTTKGDANKTIDGATVTQDNLVGKVILRLPQLGRIQFFLATKMGWFIVIFIPAAIVIIMDVIKIIKLRLLKGQIDNIKSTSYKEEKYDNEVDIKKNPQPDKKIIINPRKKN